MTTRSRSLVACKAAPGAALWRLSVCLLKTCSELEEFAVYLLRSVNIFLLFPTSSFSVGIRCGRLVTDWFISEGYPSPNGY